MVQRVEEKRRVLPLGSESTCFDKELVLGRCGRLIVTEASI
jgi:hypothetical protein